MQNPLFAIAVPNAAKGLRAQIPGSERYQADLMQGLQPVVDQFRNQPVQPTPQAPPPMQQQRGPMGPSPFAAPISKPNMLQDALNSFQRAYDPAAFKERMAGDQEASMMKQKQTLALIQQQRALPSEQRAQWWAQNAPQISQIFGRQINPNVDPSQFSDQALDQQIALMSAQLGQGPAQAEAYTLPPGAKRFGANGQVLAENPAAENTRPVLASPGQRGYQDINGDGILDEIFSVPENDPAKQANLQRVVGEDGFVYSWNPQTSETKQIIGPNGKPMRGKESGGVTINMPGSVREGVDPVTGQPGVYGIDPNDPNGGYKPIAGIAPPSNMMSAETKAKFLALAPNAFAGISRLEQLFGGKSGDDPLSGSGAAAAVASAVPVVGDVVARGLGGQKWQDFEQAWNAIEMGVHIPAGAAVSVTEAERFVKSNKPALNETDKTKRRKIANVKRFYEGLQIGFNGDWSALRKLLDEAKLSPTGQNPGAAAPALDEEEQKMIAELKRSGYTQAQIDAIINGQ